jgi:hypothetical protein
LDDIDFYSNAAVTALAARLGVAATQIQVQNVSKQLLPHAPGSLDIEPIYQYDISLECGGTIFHYRGLKGQVSPVLE